MSKRKKDADQPVPGSHHKKNHKTGDLSGKKTQEEASKKFSRRQVLGTGVAAAVAALIPLAGDAGETEKKDIAARIDRIRGFFAAGQGGSGVPDVDVVHGDAAKDLSAPKDFDDFKDFKDFKNFKKKFNDFLNFVKWEK
jgi:hypothetical protein